MKYVVAIRKYYETELVIVEAEKVEAGVTLTFYDGDKLVAAFANGEWKYFLEQE